MEAECQNQGPPGASREATGLPEGQLVHHCGAFDETPFWGGEGKGLTGLCQCTE